MSWFNNLFSHFQKSNKKEKLKKPYTLKKDDKIIGHYKNLSILADDMGFNKSSIYKAYNAKRLYKKMYKIEWQEY